MGRTFARPRPRSPPPHYSILNPSDRLIVQHPSPASIYTRPGTSTRPTPRLHHTNVIPQTITQKKPKKRHTPSFRSTTLFPRRAKQTPHPPLHAHHKRLSFLSLLKPRPIPPTPIHHYPRKPSYPVIDRCSQCRERRCTFEFPANTPSKKCRHSIRTCAYCLHECIRRARLERRRGAVRCPDCGEGLDEGDVRRGVLMWMERA
ncbi:hypothetical protein IQ07DRAFT_588075 [Pyrenochaeta sp. DS3sAY3a]|nr:hypothetical protein IQ07DRAFT_588075 [Pyrenochaeta sp. DS3sAY3a]